MKVGLYIPCYNAAGYIEKVLQAVFKQKLIPEEVVVVDDNSRDRSAELAAAYPVRLIRHRENKGLAGTRNTALKNMTSEFVAALDADCLPQPDWLEKLTQGFGRSRAVAGVGGRLRERHSSAPVDQWRAVHMRQDWGERKIGPKFLFGSNTLFKRAALLEAGLYDEALKNNYEDVDICQRLKKKGYRFIYTPGAVVEHLKRDDLYSLLNSYWRWNFSYYQKERFYSHPENFVRKLKDNIGLANRYLREDLKEGREKLLYLDFILALHHSIRDFEYFVFKETREFPEYPFLPAWLSLVDLAFFYRFDSGKEKMGTFLPEEDRLLQNFLALSLVVSRTLKDRFRSKRFRRVFYSHLLYSVYPGINDRAFLDRLLNLIEIQGDWQRFCEQPQPNLNSTFLKNLTHYLKKWLDSLAANDPQVIKMIEKAALKNQFKNREGAVSCR